MIKVHFKHDGHVTKNTFRFEEIEDENDNVKEKGEWVIGKLYIQKFAFHHTCPTYITVSIKKEEGNG